MPISYGPYGPTEKDSDYTILNIPVESGKSATFYIPRDATEDELLFIRDVLDILLKRKKQ